ncbi:uncharacterized protein LOC121423065 [Lytechinus variegatus]|uniref:uncharacterized protein LOC121423065 n=1 Tax=Lytechinus variegatus TaxID=7654 RepID=UPI001BB2BFE8|nr:uncharacterized protein LOC121423065 [Lytechinus variegatus]
MANTTSSEIAGTSTTEMPTTEELITTNSVSTSTIWTTMTSMVGYSTPTTYEAMTTPSVFSHLGEGPIMLVLDRSRKTIFVGSALNLQFATHLTIPQYVDPIGMTISTSNFRVFWTDLKTNRIHGSNLLGEYPRIYSLGLFEEPVSISYIESGGLMYCAYSESNKITRLHLGYPKCEKELIMYTPKPRALAIDKSRRSLYWSRDGGIERIDLVSLRRQTIYHNPELRNITGLAVDSGSTTVIAFLDTLIHRVFYIDLSEPDNVVELTSSFPALDFPFVTQLSVYDRDMFLTTSGDAAAAGANPGVFCMMNYTKDSRDLQFTAVDSLDDPVGIFIGQF